MVTRNRPEVDFGRAAHDYARHRPGFPPEFFDHVKAHGIGLPGQRILDLGTGTGTLACGFAERGCDVVGLAPSPDMLARATQTAADASCAPGSAPSETIADVDADLARLLAEHFPEPLSVTHRIWGVMARSPSERR